MKTFATPRLGDLEKLFHTAASAAIALSSRVAKLELERKAPQPRPAAPLQLLVRRDASLGCKKPEIICLKTMELTSLSAKEVTGGLRRALSANRKDVKIRSIQETKQGVFVADDVRTVTLIKESPNAREMAVKVEDKRKRHPKVIVYDIDRTLTESEVLSLLREQNFEGVTTESSTPSVANTTLGDQV